MLVPGQARELCAVVVFWVHRDSRFCACTWGMCIFFPRHDDSRGPALSRIFAAATVYYAVRAVGQGLLRHEHEPRAMWRGGAAGG